MLNRFDLFFACEPLGNVSEFSIPQTYHELDLNQTFHYDAQPSNLNGDSDSVVGGVPCKPPLLFCCQGRIDISK